MNALRTLPAVLAATAALCALPGTAAAAALVPPGNSAANQYTETFPTAGGNAEAKGKDKGKATPGDVLGAGNTEKLDSKGKQGRETAAVVAATAPPTATGSTATADSGGGSSEGGESAAGPGGKDSGGGTGDDQAGAGGSASGGASAQTSEGTTAADADGSSGFGEVLGQATGSSSSGGIGLLLPLIVLGSVVWAVAFFLRRRRRTA